MMDAEITGETDELLGVSVIDNNDIEHIIDLNKADGEVTGHTQDGYPNEASDRSYTEGEYVGQARNYAKYYVAEETEHETIQWDLNPERFETVRSALSDLSTEGLEEYFDDLFAQSLSHYADEPDVDIGDISRPHDLPDDMIGGDDTALYKQDIYLDEDGEIGATSGVIVSYYVAKGDRRTVRHGDAPDREPDARVEVSPTPFVEIEPFRDYMVYNLRCQIRDCYLMMGLEPPQEYTVLGHGQYRFTGKCQHFDLYPKYYDMHADIPGYSHEFTPELPVEWDTVGGLTTDSNQSIYDQLKQTLFSR
jgi:hypothetical protein